uniref:Uncharacterized protein n=1 Tax=Micrurus lemniscatus lemniscatus TaxID=129467 RepID=A0A2D4HWH7_MICLE
MGETAPPPPLDPITMQSISYSRAGPVSWGGEGVVRLPGWLRCVQHQQGLEEGASLLLWNMERVSIHHRCPYFLRGEEGWGQPLVGSAYRKPQQGNERASFIWEPEMTLDLNHMVKSTQRRRKNNIGKNKKTNLRLFLEIVQEGTHTHK